MTEHISYVNKNWKYLSVGLMVVLAIGVSFPQAFAAPIDTVLSLVTQMDQKLDQLQSDINELKTAGSYNPPTCVTLDINRDGILDKHEISPMPHPRVDYFGCDLTSADLSGVDLRAAHLVGANLYATNLTHANLRSAMLDHAYLQDTVLADANLRGAQFINAYLQDADLSNADLRGATLSGADLTGADFTGANLTGANFDNTSFGGGIILGAVILTYGPYGPNPAPAILLNANFTGANLTRANFANCIGDPVGTPAIGTLPDCV